MKLLDPDILSRTVQSRINSRHTRRHFHSDRHLGEYRLSKCILTWSMELASKGVRNWCWQVNKSLVCLQLPSMLINQGQYTACSSTLNFIKTALMEMANSKWHNLLNRPTRSNSETGGKLRHYRVFKTEPSPAGYVLAPLGPGQRWAMASLRSGCLPLAVETGRYRIPKVPLNQRTCKSSLSVL